MNRKLYAFQVRYFEDGQIKKVQGAVALPDKAEVSTYLWAKYRNVEAFTAILVGEEGVTFPLRFGA